MPRKPRQDQETPPARPTAKQRLEAKRARRRTWSYDRQYHVVRNVILKSWDVMRDDEPAGGSSRDLETAIGFAVRAARLDQKAGLNVIVCVQQKDGTLNTEWTSMAD